MATATNISSGPLSAPLIQETNRSNTLNQGLLKTANIAWLVSKVALTALAGLALAGVGVVSAVISAGSVEDHLDGVVMPFATVSVATFALSGACFITAGRAVRQLITGS